EAGAAAGAGIAIDLVPSVVDHDTGIIDVGAGIAGEGRRKSGGVDLLQIAQRATSCGDVTKAEVGRRFAEAEGDGRGAVGNVDVGIAGTPPLAWRDALPIKKAGAAASAGIAVGLVPAIVDHNSGIADAGAGIAGKGRRKSGGVDLL